MEWRRAAQGSRDRKAAQLEVEARQERRIVADALGLWREKTREKKLAPIVSTNIYLDRVCDVLIPQQAEETSNRHEDAILFAVWDKWKAKATVSVTASICALE